MSDIEDELIRRAQSSDTEAFCLLAKGYERRIYLLAFHYCHNPQDAEDLSQEVWLKAYQALGTFRGESSFYTWLRKITINCFLNHQRARRYSWRGQKTDVQLLAVDSIGGDERVSSAANSETILHNRILAERVMQAMSESTPPQRLIFLLKHHEGMTYEEIAKAVGCSTGTAKKSVSRAVGKLREHLDIEVQSPATFRGLQAKIEIGV
ncbi:MAG TPA: sigma-70 family RNA polymerase sigma factor [Pyrinomonadaceae bacterium]|nr:sigma-70 family RNA polymerase sigma factor [Pyrinomonadaceae bacterium]